MQTWTIKRLNKLLADRGWGQADLARALDCSVNTVWYWFSGKRHPMRHNQKLLDKLEGGKDND